jgi:hypothetical protein
MMEGTGPAAWLQSGLEDPGAFGLPGRADQIKDGLD